MSKNAKTPWSYIEFAGMHILLDANGMPVELDIVENRDRIVQCVNALDGVEGNILLFIQLSKANYNIHHQCLTKLEQSYNDNAVLTDLLLRIAQRLDASNIEILQDINDTLEGLKS